MTWQVVFRGSLIDGVDVDLVEWCGLPELTDEQHDQLWGDTNPRDLIERCPDAFIETDGCVDETPGQSDEFYRVETEDIDALKLQMKQVILGHLNLR